MMIGVLIYLSIFLLITILIFLLISKRRCSSSNPGGRLPPGPWPLPVIGNLLDLGKNPNQALSRLAKTYGPVMTLRLGSMTTVVVSSAEMAREFHEKHDAVFSYRSTPDAMLATAHALHSMAWIPPSQRWRHLRKISNTHLLSPHRLDAYEHVRCRKAHELVQYVADFSSQGLPVDVGRAAFTTTINLLSGTVFSTDLVDLYSPSSQDFKELIEEIMSVTGSPNISDLFPSIAGLDLQGVRRRTARLLRKLHKIFDEQIDRRLNCSIMIHGSVSNDDLLDALLQCKLEEDASESERRTMKAMLTDIFVAGSETSSSTVEWAMAELIRHPEAMAKVQEELRRVIGVAREVKESDILDLPYLQAVVKETLRLHPPTPLLVPRRANATVVINGGYAVPEGARVIVNFWAIGRDGDVWKDPERFKPERFVESEVDFRGKHFELIPFGAGRRICPGMPLASRMMHLILATLLHKFDWKLPEGMESEDLDMSEKFGFTLCMASPLKALATPAN